MTAIEVRKTEFIVSVAFTYMTMELEPISNLYVFNDDGLLKMYADTKKHQVAMREYELSGCYDWYFFNKEEFNVLLLESCVYDERYRGISDLNSYVVGVLSYKHYGDCNTIALIQGYLYVGVDKQLYYYIGRDIVNDLLFVLLDDISSRHDGEYQVYRNVDVITVDIGFTLGLGISKLEYELLNENKILLKF